MKEVAAIDRAIDELLVQLGQMVLRLSSPQVTKRADERRALVRSVNQYSVCAARSDDPRVHEIKAERERLAGELARRGWQTLPSAGNFLLAKPPGSGADTADWLQKGGLIVRSYAGHPRLNDWLRLSIRAPEEDDRLLRRLDTRAR